jgi:hypothetical protein
MQEAGPAAEQAAEMDLIVEDKRRLLDEALLHQEVCACVMHVMQLSLVAKPTHDLLFEA